MGIQSCLLSDKSTGKVSVDFRPSPRKELIWPVLTLVVILLALAAVAVVAVVVLRLCL